MPDSSNKIIKDLLDEIDSKVFDFQAQIPEVQKEILKEVLKLGEDFYFPAKTVEQQASNLKLISKIKGKINSIVLTDQYDAALKEYIKGFDNVAKIQADYFSRVFSESISSVPLLNQIKKTSIELTVQKLTSDGIVEGISGRITDIINRNITTGGKYSDFVLELKDFLTDKDGSPGALSRYAQQIANDSLNVFSAQYTKAVTDDLGLEWFVYVGSLVEKSRPFCKKLIQSKNNCLPYIHTSQLDEIAKGYICDEVVSTKGLIPGTNGENLPINRGGWNCGHQLIPISEFIVPEELRKIFV